MPHFAAGKTELGEHSFEVNRNPPVYSNLFDFHLILFIVFLALPLIDPVLRYAKYALPIIAFLTLLISLRFETGSARPLPLREALDYYYRWSILYLLLIAYSFCFLALKGDLFFRFFANSFFMVSPLVAVYIIFHYFNLYNAPRYIKTMFWGLLVIQFLRKSYDISSLSVQTFLEAFVTSQLPTETNLAFHFGLLLIYFALSKNLRYSIGSAVMTLLCFKRIVFPAVIFSLCAYYVLEKMKFGSRKWGSAVIPFLAIINLLAVYLSYQFAYGQYDLWLYNLTERSPNEIFVGRQFIYSNVLSQIKGMPWLGIGIGKIDELAFTLFYSPLNLHSDLLKNYFEFGVFFYVIWICLLYWFNFRSPGLIALALYLNILFLTDNTFIYFDVIYLFYLLSGILVYQFYAQPPNEPPRNRRLLQKWE
jgi:hypothetical protein